MAKQKQQIKEIKKPILSWRTALILMLFLIIAAFAVGYLKGSGVKEEEDTKYAQYSEAINFSNGGVKIELGGTGLEYGHSLFTGDLLLCGQKQSKEECWQDKKDKYIGKNASMGGICASIDQENDICCINYGSGYLVNEETENETIKFERKYTQCYFDHPPKKDK